MAPFTRLLLALQLLSFILLALAAPKSRSNIAGRGSYSNTVDFVIDLQWGDINPVGGPIRKGILTNGTFPGPALKINVGDKVNFMVYNNLPNPTTIHFHGITQLNTPWSDGTPGLTQKPIAPGKSFTYQWAADESGIYFYHAHYKGQIMDGLYGAIIIQPGEQDDRPYRLISSDVTDQAQMRAADQNNTPIFISDYSQFTSQEFYDIQAAANVDNSCSDSIIINGQGSVYCLSRDEITTFTSPKLPPLLATIIPPQLTDKACLPPNLVATQGNFTFNLAALPPNAYYACNPSTGTTADIMVDKSKKWAALTFINVGGFSTMKFTIDSHKLNVYAVNGRYITPQTVDQVTVNNGDRYSVLIKLDQPIGQYTIRVANNGLNQVLSGFALLNYVGSVGISSSAVSVMNFAGVNTTTITTFNNALGAPFPPIAPANYADATFKLNIKKTSHAYTWTLSGLEEYNMANEDVAPLLFQDPASIPARSLILRTNKGQWIDLIVQVAGPIAQPHPMHKHSNKMFLLGSGAGPFNYSTVAEAAAAMPAGSFNFVNPPYSDGFTSRPVEGNSSWMALRYEVVNPGAFLFHCHMQTHMSGGMAVAMLDGVDAWPTVPVEYLNGGNGILPEKQACKP